MKNKEKKIDAFVDKMIDLFDELTDEDRRYAADQLCFNAALYGGDTGCESIGILECVKHDLFRSFDNEDIATKLDKEISDALKEEIKEKK